MTDLPQPFTPAELLSYLRSILEYDPATGIFTRKVRRGSKAAGSRVGSLTSHGYIDIRIFNKSIYGHRLAIAFSVGEWPSDEVDHVNGCRSDNRIANLRVAGKTRNMQNMKRPAHNKSGVKGVGFARRERKWRARINVGGVEMHLGYFDTKSDAASAYAKAAANYFGEFARIE